MSPYIFVYNSIAITWFMFLGLVSVLISYFIIRFSSDKEILDKDTKEGIFLILIIVGLIGSRLGYVLMNLDAFRNNLPSVLKLTHYNLNLAGGVTLSLATLFLLSKRYKVSFYNLLNIYILPFYFSMAIGVWFMFFNGSLLGKEYSGLFSIYQLGKERHPVVLYASILFFLGVIIESVSYKKINKKYVSYVSLGIIMVAYYGIKVLFGA